MSTVTKAFTAAGVSAVVSLQPGQSVTYSSSGVFTGYVRFQISRTQGASWETVQDAAVDTNLAGGTWRNESNAEQRFRFQAFDTDAVTPMTGTCTAVVTDNTDVVRYLKDDNGRVYAKVTDDGVEFLGTVSIADVLTVVGNLVSKAGAEDTLTAHAGGTQAAALALSASAVYHRISVCATAGDSVILPAATVGKAHYIRNDGAASAQVYAALTETINGVASATGVPLGSGSGVWYVCTTAGEWTTAAGDELDGKWQVNASGAFLPNADATYDIGNGASDPRDVNISRDFITRTGGVKSLANVGTVPAGVTAVEYGDGRNHQTVLTVNTTLGAIAGGAALGLGHLLYTLPAGAQVIDSAYMSLALTQTQGHINADTPKVGLGQTVASGVVSVLNGTPGFMDVITEQTAANCTGTATAKTAAPTSSPFKIVSEAGGTKTVYANFAATWAAGGDAAAVLTGTVVLNWRTMA